MDTESTRVWVEVDQNINLGRCGAVQVEKGPELKHAVEIEVDVLAEVVELVQ